MTEIEQVPIPLFRHTKASRFLPDPSHQASGPSLLGVADSFGPYDASAPFRGSERFVSDRPFHPEPSFAKPFWICRFPGSSTKELIIVVTGSRAAHFSALEAKPFCFSPFTLIDHASKSLAAKKVPKRCPRFFKAHYCMQIERKTRKTTCATLQSQTGDGHFSPIGGYHAARDLVLILDVARFKYPPHWVPLPLLWQSMQQTDRVTGESRGYVVLTPPAQPAAALFTLVRLSLCFSFGGSMRCRLLAVSGQQRMAKTFCRVTVASHSNPVFQSSSTQVWTG